MNQIKPQHDFITQAEVKRIIQILEERNERKDNRVYREVGCIPQYEKPIAPDTEREQYTCVR